MSYKFRLKLGEVEFELEGDKDFLDARLSNLSWIDAILSKLKESKKVVQAKRSPLENEKLSFVEFATTINPRKNWEKFLTIAYYLYKQEGRDLTYEDVENYYRQARWPIPGNARDVMSNLIREGYMEDAGRRNDRKAFRILRRGIEYVEAAGRRGESR